MRLPLGSVDVSASGGTAVLLGRRGEPWPRIATRELSPEEALDRVGAEFATGRVAPGFAASVPSAEGCRFTPGQDILWRYGRHLEAVRVVRDDDRGLVVWIPPGSERLESVPADGRRTRDVPMAERFSVPWVIRAAHWTGPGLVRVAPTGKPWSVWFFRRDDGTPTGAYVNLELPHRRDAGGVYSRDLVMDLWVDAGHAGSEDVWLKDADELEATVAQGRYTAEQAEAIRCLADLAGRELVAPGAWPLDEDWGRWTPSPELDVPVRLPDSEEVRAARRRSGRVSGEG